MKAKLYLGLALAASVLALLLGMREARQARSAQAEADAQAAQRDQLDRGARQVEATLAILRRREDSLTARLHSAPAPAPEADSAGLTSAQGRLKVLHTWYALANARLYRRLALSADITQRLEDLQASHWLRLEDIEAAQKAQGLGADDPTVQALRTQETAQFQQAEAALLGPNDYQTAQEYDRLTSGRMVADAVAGNVFDTESPLSGKQADALAQIVANNSPSYQAGGPALTRDMDFSGVLQQAQQVLTPTQFSALQNYLMGISAARSVGMLTNPNFSFPPVN